jgi:hypothetical protein
MMNSMYMVLPPEVDTLEELEYWHNQFMQLTYYQRKTSNDISIENFGEDNITRYNKMRAKFFDKPTEYDTIQQNNYTKDLMSYFSEASTSTKIDFGDITLIQDKINEAEKKGLIIMWDPIDYTKTLEDSMNSYKKKWEKFNSLSSAQRVLSDQTAESILGMNNYNLYNLQINFYLDRMRARDELAPIENSIRDPRNDIMDVHTYYTPEEMTGERTDPLVSESGEILDKYKWSTKLEALSILLNSTTNEDKRKAIEEQIYSLWWNAQIPYTIEASTMVEIRHLALSESSNEDNSSNSIYDLAKKMLR